MATRTSTLKQKKIISFKTEFEEKLTPKTAEERISEVDILIQFEYLFFKETGIITPNPIAELGIEKMLAFLKLNKSVSYLKGYKESIREAQARAQQEGQQIINRRR